MKIWNNILATIVFISLLGCEDDIYPELPEAEPAIVVDALITNKPENQVIRVVKTQPYFDNSFPPGVPGATVTITDNEGKTYVFAESDETGVYVWSPTVEEPQFGKIGNQYTLNVQIGTADYRATSSMNRVPEIDSIAYRFEEGNDFFPDSYFAQFYAADFEGSGDAYWIKAFKNGKFLNKPGEINIAFDAAFSENGNVDGDLFIQPIRDGINPFDQDEDDEFLPPYEPGDSVYVEIHSITKETFYFLYEVSVQTDRPGGFGELFAQPMANVPSNVKIVEEGSGMKGVGFFNVAAVTGAGKRLDPDNLPPKE